MSKAWPKVKLSDVLHAVPRPVEVMADEMYREIGIRSHGKGVFHKQPVSGLELGNKKVFWIEPGDFVLNIVFAWEGAVGVLSEAERGMIGSHRFPTFRADDKRLDARFLLAFFKTPRGVELLGHVSPGGAGRNRTLSKTAFLALEIPLPPLAEQRRVVARIEELAAQIHEARTLRRQAVEEAELFYPHIRDQTFREMKCERRPIGEVFDLVNGRAFKPEEWQEKGRKIVRIQNLKYANAPFNRYSGEVESKHVIHKGDVLFAWSGQIVSLGAHIWHDDEAILNQHIFNVHGRTEFVPEFVKEGFNALIDEMKEQVRGLEMFHIRKQELVKLSFPVPPLAEQRRFVAELDALQAEVDALKRLQAETAAELDALLPALLDKAFKGER